MELTTPTKPRDLSDWRMLAARMSTEAPGLHGWHYGTYWINGTPAPLIASHLSIGNGLVPRTGGAQ